MKKHKIIHSKDSAENGNITVMATVARPGSSLMQKVYQCSECEFSLEEQNNLMNHMGDEHETLSLEESQIIAKQEIIEEIPENSRE